MSAKECLWAKFRTICPVPNACQLPQMPSSCDDCGWDSDAAWEACMERLSPIAQTVEEIIAEEKPGEYPPNQKDYLHDDLFYRLHKRDDPF